MTVTDDEARVQWNGQIFDTQRSQKNSTPWNYVDVSVFPIYLLK